MVGSALSSYKKRSGPCEKERAQWKKFTACECSKHDTLRDGWVIIFDRVYDITVFAVTHPGFDNAGQVSTALAITRSKSPPPPLSFSLLTSLSDGHRDHAYQQRRERSGQPGQRGSGVLRHHDFCGEHIGASRGGVFEIGHGVAANHCGGGPTHSQLILMVCLVLWVLFYRGWLRCILYLAALLLS